MAHDVSVIGLYILDVLGCPVTKIPDGGNVEFIDEIRLTVAGTAGGTVVDTAKLGLKSLAVGAVGNDEKADWVISTSMVSTSIPLPCSAWMACRRNHPECASQWRATGTSYAWRVWPLSATSDVRKSAPGAYRPSWRHGFAAQTRRRTRAAFFLKRPKTRLYDDV